MAQLDEEGLHGVECASTGELVDNGEVGVVGVVEVRVIVGGVVEDSEGEVEVLLAGDDGDEVFWVEALGPGFDWWCDSVGFEELVLGVNGGDVVVEWVGEGGVGGGRGGGKRTGDGGCDVEVVAAGSHVSCHVFQF